MIVGENAFQRLPFIGCITDAKMRGGFARESALLEIGDGGGAVAQAFAVKACCRGHGFEQALIARASLLARRNGNRVVILRHFQTALPREFVHGLDKAQAAVFHEEADDVAVHAAAKAMVELLRRADRKRRGFLAVERTAGEIVGAGLLERQMTLDDVNDVDAGEQVLDEGLRNHGRGLLA